MYEDDDDDFISIQFLLRGNNRSPEVSLYQMKYLNADNWKHRYFSIKHSCGKTVYGLYLDCKDCGGGAEKTDILRDAVSQHETQDPFPTHYDCKLLEDTFDIKRNVRPPKEAVTDDSMWYVVRRTKPCPHTGSRKRRKTATRKRMK